MNLPLLISVSLLTLICGVVCCVWYYKATTNVPFHEIDPVDCLLSAAGAIFLTPAGLIGLVVGAVEFVNHYI